MGKGHDNSDKIKDKYTSLVDLFGELMALVRQPDFCGVQSTFATRFADTSDEQDTNSVFATDIKALLNAVYFCIQGIRLPAQVDTAAKLADFDLNSFRGAQAVKMRSTTLSGFGGPLGWHMQKLRSHPAIVLGAGIADERDSQINYAQERAPTEEELDKLMTSFPRPEKYRLALAAQALSKWSNETLACLKEKGSTLMKERWAKDMDATNFDDKCPIQSFLMLNALVGSFIWHYIRSNYDIWGANNPFKTYMKPNETATQFLSRLRQNCTVFDTLSCEISNLNKFFLFESSLDQAKYLQACDNMRPSREKMARDPWFLATTIAIAYDRILGEQKASRHDNTNSTGHNGQNHSSRKRRNDHADQPSIGYGIGKRPTRKKKWQKS